MEVDESDDVVIRDSNDEMDCSNKPLIQLMMQLTRDNEQKAMLSNAEIIDILMKEVNINIWDIHELESDIYIAAMKLHLKEWPEWEEFDELINDYKQKNDTNAIKKVIHTNYKKLKEHLLEVFQNAQELTKDVIQKVKEDLTQTNYKMQSNVVIEVTATRAQLNKLFYRRPPLKHRNTIFNHTKHTIPTHITVNEVPMEAILNWWGVNIFIKVVASKIRIYEREVTHDFKHVLVNKNYNIETPLKELEQDLKVRVIDSTKTNMTEFIDILNTIYDDSNKEIYDFIKKDLKLLPDVIFYRTMFRRYTNKYPYVRYLYQDMKKSELQMRKFDIQLQETISPQYQVYIRSHPASQVHLIIECDGCALRFEGPNLIQELRAHFNEFHLNEPNCVCTKCNKSFSAIALSQNWWCHRC